MRFRPRYSLLTLLVVTALVAGGTWFWFKPTRFVFDLAQEWDYVAEHGLIEEDLRNAAAYSARQYEGSLVYEARRTLTGSKELLAAKYQWKTLPTLARFTRQQGKRDCFLLSNSSGQALIQELQYIAEQYKLTLLSTEKANCWVSSQVNCLDYVQVEITGCATGLCHLPVGPDPEARTSYLFTDSGKIYQLNLHGERCDLKNVTLNQVADSCRTMLAEEISKIVK